MKKRILTAIALTVIFALVAFVAACGTNVTLNVVAEFDSEKGSIVVADADGNEKSEFVAGDKVVVRVAAADGYEIDVFTVNGVDTELNNGIYGFYITANTIVKATFKSTDDKSDEDDNKDDDDDDDDEKTPEQLFDDALKAAQTTFTAIGSYVQVIKGGKNNTYNITTVFGDKAVNIIELDDSGEVVYDDVYVDVDGKIAMPYHTINNEIKYYYADGDESFEEYGNPFKLLSSKDFTATDSAKAYALSDEKAKAAATALTGYNEEISSFTVTVSGGKITTIDIITKSTRIRVGEDDDGKPVYSEYVSTYVFAITELGTAEVDSDKIAPYATAPEHTALKAALKKASEAKNYTVGVSEVSLTALDDDLEYEVYVTEKAIYYDCEGYEEGYVQMGEGAATVVYPFDYEPETERVKLYDAVKGFPTIYSMRASFNGFAPEIFVLNDSGDYVLREECNTAEFIRDVLINFGEGLDQIRLYAGYSLSVKFVLKDNALYQVELYYYVGDAFIKRTLTYSAWDGTVMPIGFDNCEKQSVLDDYVGTYTDGKITAVIDKNGIVINDKAFEITNYDIQYDMFAGNWNGEEWYITKQGEKQLLLLYFGEDGDDDITYTLTSTAIDPVKIPTEFNGVWSVKDVTVAIAYDIVEYNGTMHTVLSYDNDKSCLYTTDGAKTYRMFADDDKDGNPVLLVIVYVDGLSTAYYDMKKVDGAVIVPKALLGTFEKFDGYYMKNFKATLTLTAVALEFGNDKPEVAIVSAERVSNRYWQLTLDVDGEEYFIMENSYSADKIDLVSEESGYSVMGLERVQNVEPPEPDGSIPDTFYGTFTGSKDDTEYTVTIGAKGVTLKIGDAEAIEVEYEYDDGDISFVLDGVMWGITSYDYDTTVESVYLWNYSNLYIELARS